MALLDGLDRVPWGDLSHAYGRATDVPDLLRALEHVTEARVESNGVTFGNDYLLLNGFGLPTTRDELRARLTAR